KVTGVQTCALPIWRHGHWPGRARSPLGRRSETTQRGVRRIPRCVSTAIKQLFRRPGPSDADRMLDTELVEDAGDDEVHQVLDSSGPSIETRRGWQDYDAEASQLEEVLEDDRAQGRLARDEDEGPPFLEGHRGRAGDQVVRDARGDLRQGGPAARDDHEGPEPMRPGGRGRREILAAVEDVRGARELLGGEARLDLDHRGRVLRQNDIRAGSEDLDQTAGIQHPGGPRAGDEESRFRVHATG